MHADVVVVVSVCLPFLTVVRNMAVKIQDGKRKEEREKRKKNVGKQKQLQKVLATRLNQRRGKNTYLQSALKIGKGELSVLSINVRGQTKRRVTGG